MLFPQKLAAQLGTEREEAASAKAEVARLVSALQTSDGIAAACVHIGVGSLCGV